VFTVRKLRRPKQAGKRVAYKLIDPKSDQGKSMYARLRAELEQPHHEDIAQARVALAWCTSWKPDVDGRVTLGKCRKASDLDREFIQFDYVILLNQAWWFDLNVDDAMRDAVLDHELCHAAPALDLRTGDQVRDERGRLCWRIRKHDLEEFVGVAERRGTYKRDIEAFYAALRRAAVAGYEPCADCKETPGWRAVAGAEGQPPRVTRCECWSAWRSRVDGVTPALQAAS
jgi:hypothetical protein